MLFYCIHVMFISTELRFAPKEAFIQQIAVPDIREKGVCSNLFFYFCSSIVQSPHPFT